MNPIWEPFIGKQSAFEPLFGAKSDKSLPCPPIISKEIEAPKLEVKSEVKLESKPVVSKIETQLNPPTKLIPKLPLKLDGFGLDDSKKKWALLVLLLIILAIAFYVLKLKKDKQKKTIDLDKIETSYQALKAFKARKKNG